MGIQKYQRFINVFCKGRNWYRYGPFIHSSFLIEEADKVYRTIRAIEVGHDRSSETVLVDGEDLENLTEELSGVLDNLFILTSKCSISPEMVIQKYRMKLMERHLEE